MASPFVQLHVHSSYSPMAGIPSLPALCLAAQQQQASALALTDTNGLYGIIRFIELAREAGLRAIIGTELTHQRYRAVLLARSADGYANLCRLLSARHCDANFDLTRAVKTYRHGLIILSDDLDAVQQWKHESREDLFVELTPGAMMHQALAFSRAAELPPVATTRAHFLHPAHHALHRVLRAIALNTTLSRLPADTCAAPSHWFMPLPELMRQFPHVPHALENTGRIADRCKTDWDFKEVIFPQFRKLSHPDALALLRAHVEKGARWRYGTMTDVIRARIEHELKIIGDKGYADYFLVVEEIVRQAPRTCGRGSGAASIVSYCLGITHVDPIRHNLFFERFLNPGRADPPDIDLDFPWDERDRILDWVFARYGSRSAAMVANQNMLGVRGALREVAKVYGMPPDEIKAVSTKLSRLAAVVGEAPTPQEWVRRVTSALKLQAPWPTILHLVIQIDEQFRNLSLHCGGIVIVPDEIRRYVPVEISAKGLPVIQFEKDQTEAAGLVKIDLLGNRSLAVIRDALAAIAKHTARVIDYATWDPIEDGQTQTLIRAGDTMGCFYVESPATRLLLKKLWGGMPRALAAKADVFEYLTVVSSLIRPAANHFIDEFLRRAHGEPHKPLHPALEEMLQETHGILVYQEDVTKVAMALAGFSIEDADQLRKVLSKKHKEKKLRDYYAQFVEGASRRGVTPTVIREIWEMIISFAGYSFCKPHSASYAQVSFKSAFLRAHYPAEFMAAVISNEGGFYSPFAYLSEARRMGLNVLPPDVNASDWHYTGRARAIRLGFMQIKSLRRELVEHLIEERVRGGAFHSLGDLLDRVQLDASQARLLIKAGCCDSVAGELTRPALLWRLLAHGAKQAEVSLLGTAPLGALPIPDEYSRAQKIQDEMELFGFPLSCHPIELHAAALSRLPILPASLLEQSVGSQVQLVGCLITEKPAETKHDEPMEFATFEDLTALYDVTIFPKVYREVCQHLCAGGVYVLEGLVESTFGTVTVTLERLWPLDGRNLSEEVPIDTEAANLCDSEEEV
jgi:error-prone DNA polymerase